jgi:hypothetical protein
MGQLAHLQNGKLTMANGECVQNDDTKNLPDPLTPPDCDLRGMPDMPIDVHVLLTSDIFLLSTGDEFKAAFALWCHAFFQIPAGSLPDNLKLLETLSGFGRKFARIKEVALRGFIKCSDGRLYHPMVCRKALIAWNYRLNLRAKTRNATDARMAKRRDVTLVVTSDVTCSTILTKLSKEKEREEREDVRPSFNLIAARASEKLSYVPSAKKNEDASELPTQKKPDEKNDDAKPAAAKTRAEAMWGAEPSKIPLDPLGVGVVKYAMIDPDSGKLEVAGIILEEFGKDCRRAAKMSETPTLKDFQIIAAWLAEAWDDFQIIDLIKDFASRSNYKQPFSLGFFDKMIRADLQKGRYQDAEKWAAKLLAAGHLAPSFA